MNFKLPFFIGLLLIVMNACVPHQKFVDIQNKQEACEAENKKLRAQFEQYETKANELQAQYDVAQRRIEALKSDTAILGSSIRILRSQYDKINQLNQQLLNKTASLRAGTEAENQNLMAELDQVRVNLQAKEDALNQLEMTLNAKQDELEDREAKLDELRSTINYKDSVMQALRTTVANALLGFEGEGLTVEKRNGRVYVRMEAKLLFATGSTEVSQKGKQAVIDLARAIQGRDDLRIMVEGHTDTDEFHRDTYPRNNWDLSVLRATSVINIMLDNSDLNPAVLVAAGRSQYHPVDPNDKSKNRRIEVIISPKLDVLMGIINDEGLGEDVKDKN